MQKIVRELVRGRITQPRFPEFDLSRRTMRAGAVMSTGVLCMARVHGSCACAVVRVRIGMRQPKKKWISEISHVT